MAAGRAWPQCEDIHLRTTGMPSQLPDGRLGCARFVRFAARTLAPPPSTSPNPPAPKNSFRQGFQSDHDVHPSTHKYFTFFFSEIVVVSLHPASSTRGVSRSSRTWRRGAMAVEVSGALARRRLTLGRTVKPCGSDTPMLVSRLLWRSRVAQAMVAKKPGAPGRARSTP